MTKQLIRLLSFGLIFSVFLGGCVPDVPEEPSVFGVPESQWDQLSPNERSEVIQGYNQQQYLNAQNAPIENLITSTKSVIKHSEAPSPY